LQTVVYIAVKMIASYEIMTESHLYIAYY